MHKFARFSGQLYDFIKLWNINPIVYIQLNTIKHLNIFIIFF